MTIDTLLTGGTIVTATHTFNADVAITDGKISAIGSQTDFPAASEVVDVSGKLVMPGFVDPHVHIDDSASIDTYETATTAAALGGITTVIDFAWQTANNNPENPPRPLLEGIERKQEKAEDALIDYSLHGGITVETDSVLDELSTAVEMGVTSFKMFTAYDFGISNGFIYKVLDRIADLNAVGVFHTEDNSVCETLVEDCKSRGRNDPMWYPQSRPDFAEAMAAENVLRMAMDTGAKYYGIHTSCRKSAEVIDRFRNDGSQVRAETCTHYTTLDDSVYETQGNLPLIAPPIRKPDDIEAMFEYLRSGTLDIVSTDHAPHSSESKQVDWWDSPYGAGSLQRSVPVFHDEAVNRRGLGYPFLVRVMSTAPAQIFGLSEKGTLAPGTDADIVVFDPEETKRISGDENASRADFTIYEGRDVTGTVQQTYVRGERVVDEGNVVGRPGHGQYVSRSLPEWDPTR
ncbi:allantoinase [Haladaptatus sp. W1]|uniref:dihydroorotase n=1 Tax=Haladaptatus sp. W1 TaxID=1897478 RepID=UPI0008499BD2|nr:amidohydrolase family protein [Haladaptatus sp. W1]ODR80592.1 allantoinase [Haladaptatus sp. W1]